MTCSIDDLKAKEVICVSDGAKLGFVSDVEIDLESGRLVSVIVQGNYKFMGMFGKEEDIVIKWENIKKIGDDVIIIEDAGCCR